MIELSRWKAKKPGEEEEEEGGDFIPLASHDIKKKHLNYVHIPRAIFQNKISTK